MTNPITFDEFLPAFFGIFTQRSFRGNDFLNYLHRADAQRSGDEASIVDTAIASPLLGLLGFEAGERVYNQQHLGDRPDFAPSDAVYGTCFIVEDKSTSLSLTFDLSDPESHLSQLRGYMRGVRLGWLTNGKQLTAWRFDDLDHPQKLIDLDIPSAIQEWNQDGISTLSDQTKRALHDLFEMFQKESFTTLERLESELALDETAWHQQALPLGNGSGNEPVLVEALQSLVLELQRNARHLLAEHLRRYTEYQDKSNRISDDAVETAKQEIQQLQALVFNRLNEYRNMIGLDAEEQVKLDIESVFLRLEQDARAYISPKEVFTAILAILTQAFLLKQTKLTKSNLTLERDYATLNDALKPYVERVFAWHQRQATLRQVHQNDIRVHDDYTVWTALVQETMLGGLEESQRQDEFALQAAYVVFIRLLLIRVCEDKGVFPHRFVSDGGIKKWQENIDRYWQFATGNPYDPLMDMAYNNAQNIYAHFFTGRELFNWFLLDQQQLVMTLHKLSKFNFAGVDSDIVGTVYSTYVNRKEKKEKGQYYTPIEIVNYILDEVGYQTGASIVGANKRLIDPACGSGSFLVAAAKRLVETYKKGRTNQIDDPVSVLDRVQSNLYGFDLNPFACYLSEVNLLIQVLDLVKLAHDKGKHPKIQRFHIYNVDALARPTGSYRSLMFNTLIAEESDQVDQIKSRSPNTPYENGFAFVVANPPYGAILSDEYKSILRADYADIFYGRPDTYTFFLKLGIELLSKNGKFGFITPNTYLMGTNTSALREELLNSGRIEQIVDLPQGIWSDANVDCVLIFISQESNEEKRKENKVKVNLLGVRDTLEKLTKRLWVDILEQSQLQWLVDPKHEINIRYDQLIQSIEDACKVLVNGNLKTKILRLDDVVLINRGVEPYHSREQGRSRIFIKNQRELTDSEYHWKPLLDGTGFVGRYELRWGKAKPHLHYGDWLYRAYDSKFYESPKLLVQSIRNRALQRRLVSTFDDQKFYNRHNFNNIISKEDDQYQLKYILSLFNSLLLNYWYSSKFQNVNINPAYFRQLPIYPADAETQAELVKKVDLILEKNAQLNQFREQDYIIRKQRDRNILIEIPYDRLLGEIQQSNSNFSTLTLFDAQAIGLFTIPDRCNLEVTLGSNIYIPNRYPNSIVLRNNKLWLVVEDDNIRRYIVNYLKRPQWQNRTWDEIKNKAILPTELNDFNIFFAAEQQRRNEIQTLLDEVAQIDAEIDEKVLDLYGITEPSDRQRILGSVATIADDETDLPEVENSEENTEPDN